MSSKSPIAKTHPNVNNLDTSEWKGFDWISWSSGMKGDGLKRRGALTNPWKDYEIHREIINAAHFLHAKMLFFMRHVENDLFQCALCNHHMKYAVIFKDQDGKMYSTGEDCANFIDSKMSREKYSELKFFHKIKKRNTKNGERYTLNFPLPPGFWDQWNKWKDNNTKPSYISISKLEPKYPYEGGWRITIWGESKDEVFGNYLEYRDLVEGT